MPPREWQCSQGYWIYLYMLYFRIRHSFAQLRPVILSADWSISRLQSWTCSSLPTVAEFVKSYRNSATSVRWLVQSPTLQLTIFCDVHSDLHGKGIGVSPASAWCSWCMPRPWTFRAIKKLARLIKLNSYSNACFFFFFFIALSHVHFRFLSSRASYQ